MNDTRTVVPDRVENWRRFSAHMEEYIAQGTVKKYSVPGSVGCDLIGITNDGRVCVWNILKYAIRLWNGHAKRNDLEKIAHYGELAWTLGKGVLGEGEGGEDALGADVGCG